VDPYRNSKTYYNLDMVRVSSGEILTVYGNYDGPWFRARLSFYRSATGSSKIDGLVYEKVKYDVGYHLGGYEKLLDLPGEQHFRIHRSRVEHVYRPPESIEGLPHEYRKTCGSLIEFLWRSCGIGKERHGLAGSAALHCIRRDSDLDWVIYEPYSACVKSTIVENPMFVPTLTFTMAHAYRKCSVFKGLKQEHLDALIEDRWKYFRYGGAPISLNFVDTAPRADPFLRVPTCGKRFVARARVIECSGSYDMPKLFPVECDGRVLHVLTWLFMYNGAFQNDDMVEIAGSVVEIGGQEYILVESTNDYIRNISAEERKRYAKLSRRDQDRTSE